MKPCDITPNYKFNEGELIEEFVKYINSTYDQHYAKEKFQATEFIIDGGHGTGFCIGNVLKYAQRYGKKGNPEDHRKDLMKVLHYALIQLYIHDEEYGEKKKLDKLAPFHHNGHYTISYNHTNPVTDAHNYSIDNITPEEWDESNRHYTKSDT